MPIPARILQLGADAPEARALLWARWGTVWRLRHARVLDDPPDRRLRRTARVIYAFWSADWTPWQALCRIRQNWPKLLLAVTPHYDDD